MDWHAAIDKNREALKRVLAMLVGMAGGAVFTSPLRGGRAEGAGGGDLTEPSSTPTRQSDDYLGRAACLARPSDPHKGEVGRPTLPRSLHRAILRLLRPAEAAARRLVIVAALKESAKAPPPRAPIPPEATPRFSNPSANGRASCAAMRFAMPEAVSICQQPSPARVSALAS